MSGVGGPTGRVLVKGGDWGVGFAIGPRLAVTANHVVRDRGDRPVSFVPIDGVGTGARVEADDGLDVAVLHLLDGEVGRTASVGRAAEGDAWRVETRPKDNDPVLTGRVTHPAWRVVNAQGQEVEVLQLHVDQALGGYRGYSGSPVVLETPRDAVIGVLVEQQRWRQPELLGQPLPAANVLYAIPIETVVARFAIKEAVEVAHPHPFLVPRPPSGLIVRPGLLNRLLDALDTPGAGVIVVRGMPGMGKTVLCQQAAYHSRTWSAYPGGVIQYAVGENVDATELLDRLRDRLRIGIASLGDVFRDGPALLLLDDVWSQEVIDLVRANLPDHVTLLATTRGVPYREATAVVPVDAMTPAEAIDLLARATPRAPELDASLDHLARVLGHWPLLIDLAARHLHDDDLVVEDDLASVDQAARQPSGDPADLASRAEALVGEFADDPTVLDDPDSRQRSFERMLRRSLDRLSDQAKQYFGQLAVYPADADLTQTMLGDLWLLDPLRTRKQIVALARVGLVTVTRARAEPAALRLRLHDLVTAWLHHEYGSPEPPNHSDLHRRCASPAITSEGTPGDLASDRATWLSYHLCRTDALADPAALLRIPWRNAYRAAVGSDAPYLAALREIARHYATRLDTSPSGDDAIRVQLTAWVLKAALLHAHLSDLVGEIPSSALAAQALLGQPEAAAHQAASSPNPDSAGRALSTIAGALRDHGTLTPEILELIMRLALELREPSGSETLGEITRILAFTDPDRALTIAEQVPDERHRSKALAAVAGALTSTDPKRAHEVLDSALAIAEQITAKSHRSRALAGIALALAPADPDRALSVAEQIRDKSGRTKALAEIAPPIAFTAPDRALTIADQIHNEWHRSRALAGIALALGPADPGGAQQVLDSALAIAEQITDTSWRSRSLAGIAWAAVPTDPDRALVIADQIAGKSGRSRALAGIARALAPTDPDRALTIAEQIPPEWIRSEALAEIAPVLSPGNLDRALTIAEQIPNEWHRSRALAGIALALAHTDPDGSQQVLDSALTIAERIPSEWIRSEALAEIARALARADPDRALTIAEQNPDRAGRSAALAVIAQALGSTDPDRAVTIAQQIPDESPGRSQALAWIVQAVAPTDPDRALTIAEQLPDEQLRPWLRSVICYALAPIDPDRALTIAEQIPGWARSRALAWIAQALAPTDPDRALTIAEQIAIEWERSQALAWIAQALAPTDPDRALTIAEQIPDESPERTRALAWIAQALAPIDPDRALTIAEQIRAEFPADWIRSEALAGIARALASTDLDQALTIAKQIHKSHRSQALAGIAQALALNDPDQALTIAEQILEKSERSSALAEIAQALASTDPDRALTIATRIPDEIARSSASGIVAGALGNGASLSAGVSGCWSRVTPSLRFTAAFIDSQHFADEHMRVVAAEVAEVLQRFQSIRREQSKRSDISAHL